jgi:hypothetical protein
MSNDDCSELQSTLLYLAVHFPTVFFRFLVPTAYWYSGRESEKFWSLNNLGWWIACYRMLCLLLSYIM